jgi:hypothetical protein
MIGRISFILLMLAAAPAGRSSPLDYSYRVQEALAVMRSASPSARLSALSRVAQLLPPEEEIIFRGQQITVSNQWLHEGIDRFIGELDDSAREKTYFHLQARLEALSDQIRRAEGSNAHSGSLERKRLEEILSRREFLKDQDPTWLHRIGRWVAESLARLFKLFPDITRIEGPPLWLLKLLLWAVTAGILYFLIMRLLHKRRERPAQRPSQRVVAGADVDHRATPEELRREGLDLARQRDYRGAIRQLYIALLLEFERRGWLELKASATNTDYLRRLQAVATIYPLARYLTRRFEYFWYGKVTPAEAEFEDFMSHYSDIRHQTDF